MPMQYVAKNNQLAFIHALSWKVPPPPPPPPEHYFHDFGVRVRIAVFTRRRCSACQPDTGETLKCRVWFLFFLPRLWLLLAGCWRAVREDGPRAGGAGDAFQGRRARGEPAGRSGVPLCPLPVATWRACVMFVCFLHEVRCRGANNNCCAQPPP